MPIEYGYDRRENTKYQVLNYFRKRGALWPTLPRYIQIAIAEWWNLRKEDAEKAANSASGGDFTLVKRFIKADLEKFRELVRIYKGKSAADEFSELIEEIKSLIEKLE